MDYPPPPYVRSTQTIALTVMALVAAIVCIPPLIWHSRNRNLPSACLITWFLILNLFNFTNSLIWPTDDIASWWDGRGFCDIHTKIMAASGVGVAGALACIFRSLAKVMDTDRTTLVPTKAERRRNLVLEIMLCIVSPVIMMFLHYVVQDHRYRIQAIIGCDPPYHASWASTILTFIWPPIELFVATIYCILVIYRLIKYRRQFSYILSSSSNANKSRFIRLLVLSLLMLLGSFPVQLYVLYFNITAFMPWAPYSWSDVHGPGWGEIIKVPANGQVLFDRWIQVTAGFLLFTFFGFGKDATLMYRSWLLKLGLGRCFTSLNHPHITNEQRSSLSTRFASFSSRAKLIFSKRSSRSGDSTANQGVGLSSAFTGVASVNFEKHSVALVAESPLLLLPPLAISSNFTITQFKSEDSRDYSSV